MFIVALVTALFRERMCRLMNNRIMSHIFDGPNFSSRALPNLLAGRMWPKGRHLRTSAVRFSSSRCEPRAHTRRKQPLSVAALVIVQKRIR